MSAGILVRRSVARMRLPITGFGPGSPLGATARRYRVELAWLGFAALNYVAMIAWPSWETIPFHFVWISLTLLYGFRVWPLRPTLLLLAGVMTMTGVSIGLDAFQGIQLWGELFEVPLMAAMFLAMVWHARRRIEALEMAQRRVEERRSLLERQGRFVHDAAHELRTPMTIARGHLELLRAHGPDSTEVSVALEELGRIDGILGRLLLLAGVEQPDFVQIVEVDLEPLLEDVFMRWAEVAPRSWRLGELAEGVLLVDSERLRTALDALLENAVKYSQPGAAIELRARHAGLGRVAIEVEDEGCGVPPEALSRIFDRFARVDPARGRSAGGVGLGLAIVDAIAKAHAGSCKVTNTPTGSVFTLLLPHFLPAGSRRLGPAPGPVAAATDGSYSS